MRCRSPFRYPAFAALLLAALTVVACAAEPAGPAKGKKGGKAGAGPERWEPTIRAFEDADRAQPPGSGGILLVGGSNARRWTDVAAFFPGETVINRGFGGARLSEVVHFLDRIVIPYAPRVVIVNAGGNDLSGGATPEAVRDSLRTLVTRTKAALPGVQILVVGVPPVLRVAETPDGLQGLHAVNALLASGVKDEAGVRFVDLGPRFVGADGKPRRELFVADGVHFTPEGYRIVADLLHAELKRAAAAR